MLQLPCEPRQVFSCFLPSSTMLTGTDWQRFGVWPLTLQRPGEQDPRRPFVAHGTAFANPRARSNLALHWHPVGLHGVEGSIYGVQPLDRDGRKINDDEIVHFDNLLQDKKVTLLDDWQKIRTEINWLHVLFSCLHLLHMNQRFQKMWLLKVQRKEEQCVFFPLDFPLVSPFYVRVHRAYLRAA